MTSGIPAPKILGGSRDCEVLYVAAAPLEHVEEYLEALWVMKERGLSTAKVGMVSKRLGVSAPSAVQMLRRLEKDGYVTYKPREGVMLRPRGRRIGMRMARNGRLIEALMEDKFRIPVDPRVSCGIEHHMTGAFADALCTMLDHPKKCPHGNPIPRGECCRRSLGPSRASLLPPSIVH